MSLTLFTYCVQAAIEGVGISLQKMAAPPAPSMPMPVPGMDPMAMPPGAAGPGVPPLPAGLEPMAASSSSSASSVPDAGSSSGGGGGWFSWLSGEPAEPPKVRSSS